MLRSRRIAAAFAVLLAGTAFAQPSQWPLEKANAWYSTQRWLVGSDYIPADAINQLEMWQADTFNPAQIDKELGWAQGIGMNTMRVFLHDKLWEQDAEGFKKRIDQFLAIAARHGIRPMLVFFDSCWDPDPKLGPQRPPTPGVHNSGWVQSPAGRASRPRLTTRASGRTCRTSCAVSPPTRASSPGTSGTSPTMAPRGTPPARVRNSRMCRSCCRRCSRGHARRILPSR